MRLLSCLFLFAMVSIRSLPAQAVEAGIELEPLFFGQVIVTDNTVVRSCTITTGGSESCDAAGLTLLSPGGRGVYRLSGFDPNTQIGAVIDQISPLANTQDGTLLDVANFTLDPPIDVAPQTPDANGTMTLNIGATLSTRAGVTYLVTPYRGTYRLTITY